MKNIQSITVDVVPGLITPPKANVIKGDSETRYIDVTALNNGEPLELEDDVTVSYVYAKPDCTQVINPATISGNVVTIELSDQCLTVAGLCSCEIQFYRGAQQLTSAMFRVSVCPGVYSEEALESSDEYGLLLDAISKAKAATVTVGEVSTLEPDQLATVTNTGTDTDAILNFGIPRGENGSGGGTSYEIGDGLKLEGNKLSVDTAAEVEQDNTKPVTSAAVYAQIGNIAALLADI